MIKLVKKVLSCTVACAVLMSSLGTLTACHGSKEKKLFEVPESFDTSKEYDITFWAKNDTNKRQVEIYQQAIADFESFYPNIHVNIRLYTDYSKIYSDVITNIATDTTPNVCITYPDHIATYLSGNHIVVPLDDLATDSRFGLGGSEVAFDAPTQEEIVPQFLEECKIQGHLYGVPFMRSTEACYVNKTYVEALGFTLPEKLTWDYVWEVSDAATKKNADGVYEINGQTTMIPFIYKSTDNMMIQMLKQKGFEYSDATGQVLLFQEDTKGILETIAEHVGKGSFSTFAREGYPANFLNAGQCIFAIDSTAGATWMGSDAPLVDIPEEKLVDFETVVYPIPQFDVEHPSMISQGPSVCIFNKEDTQEVIASWLFVQYLLTNEVQIAYSQTEGYVPVTLKAQKSDSYEAYLENAGKDDDFYYQIKIDAAKILLENPEKTFVTPVFNGSASLRKAAGDLIENTVKAVKRKKVVDDAFYETLYAEMISLYRLDQIETTDVGKMELGPLPATAKKLLGVLVLAWVMIIGYVVFDFVKKKKEQTK